MKIHVEKLKKTFEVKPTNKLMRSVYQFQLDSAKLSNMEGKKSTEFFENAIKLIDNIEGFLVNTLGLSKAEAKKLDDDFEQADIAEMANYVSSRLMGLTDEDIKADRAESQGAAPKK